MKMFKSLYFHIHYDTLAVMFNNKEKDRFVNGFQVLASQMYTGTFSPPPYCIIIIPDLSLTL